MNFNKRQNKAETNNKTYEAMINGLLIPIWKKPFNFGLFYAVAPVLRDLVDARGLCKRRRRNLPEPEPRRSSTAPSIEALPSGRPSMRHV